MESLTLNDSLTISMHENIERKFLIFIPPRLEKTSLNVRLNPYSLEEKYVVLMIPTLNDNILQHAPYQPPHLLNHLELSLPQRGLHCNDHLMKILLWNCRGANGLEFRRNLRFLLSWSNPSILCLTETKMQDHTALLQELDFSDLIQVAAHGHSGG